MNCPKCGEVVSGEGLPGAGCGCLAEPHPLAPTASECDAELASAAEPLPISVTTTSELSETAAETWREELSTRLTLYRARRKARPPRYPSLRLPFERIVASRAGDTTASPPTLQTYEPVSTQALALDSAPVALPTEESAALPYPSEARPDVRALRGVSPPTTHTGAKIIEFPRFAWGPPPPVSPDQLAEPVIDRPRILEVPEVAPPPPALGGITIEAAQRQEAEKRPGVDVPLQTTSLARRAFASTIDALIVGAASVLFGLIFWKVAAVRPPRFQLMGLALGIPVMFWAVYQYLLITYAASTPGLRFAGLKLARFDGAPTRRSLRRWRVLASYLSAASLGMGYAWVFLDEDGLCWHDRATRTHLARR